MATLNCLLAATDLSAAARHAAERAALIAKEAGASLDLVHVVSLAPLEKLRRFAAQIPMELEQRMLDAAAKELRELGAALLQHHGVRAGVRVVSGPLPAQLAAQADETSADLIVLGAHGASFMRHLLLGSSAERMISGASRPILVVKQTAHEQYQNVLVPVDFSPSSVPALRHARAVAPSAEIVLLHAFEVPFEGKLRFAGVDDDIVHHYRLAAKQEALQKLRALCDQAELPPHAARLMVLHGDPSRRIIEQEQEQDCDLIAIGKHGESMLEDLLLGSVTRRVLSESQCDVLVSV